MSNRNKKGPSINLGDLQAKCERDRRELQSAETALKKAQDLRDKKRNAALASETALRDATRAVLG